MAGKPKAAKAARPAPAKSKLGATKDGEVDAFMASLDHPLKADIAAVRKLILGVSPTVGEGVKWNAPSFRKADWFATFHLRSRKTVQLVFHTGAKARDNPDFKIPDPNGLIKWLAKDRCLITLGSARTLKSNAKAFEAIVKAWLRNV